MTNNKNMANLYEKNPTKQLQKVKQKKYRQILNAKSSKTNLVKQITL